MVRRRANQADVKYYRFKEGDHIIELYAKPDRGNEHALVFCHGMPSHPFDRFPFGLERYLNAGFILAYPHYEGTFASTGICTIDNAVNSVILSVDKLCSGNLTDIFSGEDISIKINRATLIGGSFGASVALVAGAKSEFIKDIVAVAGPVDYRKHGKIDGVAEYDLTSLQQELRVAYPQEWRIDFTRWQDFVKGDLDVNPQDYIDILKNKNTFIIHGENDNSVWAGHSKAFHNHLLSGSGRHRLVIVAGLSHLGAYYIANTNIYNQISKWLTCPKQK